MDLLLKRLKFNLSNTEGELWLNGKFFCYTIEDKVRSPLGQLWKKIFKVYTKTAIPYGKYPVLVTWSNRFKRMLTGVFNVPDFVGIRIHNGTNENSSAGCIIVSYKKQKNGWLVNEKDAMNDLCSIITEAQKTEKIFLTIK